MTRTDVNNGMQTALGQQELTILPIVHLDFADDPVFGWGGIGELNWNGSTWLGIGNMGEIGRIQSDTKGAIPSLDLSLLGLDPDILQQATSNGYRGRRGRVWLACFDSDLKMQGEPALFFAGEISGLSFVDGQERRIRVTLDSRMALLKQNKPRYRTDEDQQRKSSGDKFFSFLPSLGNRTLYWGLKSPKHYSYSGSVYSGGNGRGYYNSFNID